MNNFKQVKEEYKDKYKGFASYTECMTKALFTGLSSFALTFSVLYFSQVLLKSRLPYKPKYYLIGPSIISTLVSWTVTSRKTQICQDIWKSSEPHYTAFSVLYFSQVLLKSRLPYKPKYYLIGPSIVSTLVSWTVTSRKTQICQDIWKSSEPHYTGYEEK